MRYRRALFLSDPGKDPQAAFSVLRSVAPQLEHLLVIAPLSEPLFAWLSGERAPEREQEAATSLQELRLSAMGMAKTIDLKVAPELTSDALAALCAAEEIDLLVLASRSLRTASLVPTQRKRPPVAILWAGTTPSPRPIEHVGCVALDRRSQAAIGAFLRDHTDPTIHVTLISLTGTASDALVDALEVSGAQSAVEVSSLRDAASAREWLEDWVRRRPMDLLVFARAPIALLIPALATAPVLLLPPLEMPTQFGQRPIDVPDVVDDGGPVRVRVDYMAAIGNLAPVPDQQLSFVSAGHVVATVTTSGGEAELPAALGTSSLGVYRTVRTASGDVLAAIEQRVAVLRPGDNPLVLFDAELPDEMLDALGKLPLSPTPEVLAVRLRPTRSCRRIRQRLRAKGLPARVVDARAVLGEGTALDVSASFDPVRLARVASRMKRSGFPVTAIAHRGPVHPLVEGFVALSGSLLAESEGTSSVLSRSSTSTGNRIDIELDNTKARHWLLEVINGSQETLHLQVYMALDDEVGSVVEAALAAAGDRGVTVRVLVDSLHGLHGSFGAKNPLLERLSKRPGVELRTSRPITELPSLADLKQRDHRKLVVADGRLALLGGRNLSHEYYTGFDEVNLSPDSLWRQVPWLDAGALVEGPAVAALSSSFLEAWTEAGGAPFDIVVPQAAGPSAARVVVHRGLRDARTLEAYLELIESARSHVYAVNGFPLALEIQHALLRALQRGVRVRTLTGHLTPTHDGDPFRGPLATARTAATELVHSRMDPIIAAGGEAYLLARHDLPGWTPGLGLVRPHVHAKAMSADGLRCAVGSANLDITASYWESELLLVVEDSVLARAFETQVDTLMAGSIPMKSDDPSWQQLAKRRAWMRYWPGVLSI